MNTCQAYAFSSFTSETCLFYFFIFFFIYNPKSEKVGIVWKTQIKKESSDF